MSRVLIPFTEGVEEIECVAVVDILRRAGIETVMASLDGEAVTGRSGITILADTKLSEVADEAWEMIVLPGGLPNASLLRDDIYVKAIVQRLRDQSKTVAAICAAPAALAAFGVADHRKITSYPAMKEEILTLSPSSTYCDDAVVEDGFLITSRGAGTAVEFALHLVARLAGEAKASGIRDSIIA
jgi:4-methyl-5(b-hydroxyethyl)-thiazole monophosphate biosynthesis